VLGRILYKCDQVTRQLVQAPQAEQVMLEALLREENMVRAARRAANAEAEAE
jgi:hypothetical protein